MKIATVLKDIDPLELGFCQSHEHLAIVFPEPAGKNQNIDDPERSLTELKGYHSAGGHSLVDAQPVGCGRGAAVLARISEQSGVHIIASTGFHKLAYYPQGHWIFSSAGSKLASLFVDELETGMYLDGEISFPRQQDSHRAGQIKTALDTEGLSRRYQKLFSAAADAAKITGCALMVHIEQGADPLSLENFLENRGIPPDRMIFCHLDRAVQDIALHKELCRRGIYLEYDTIGRPKYHDDDKELENIQALLEAGYECRLLMSLDTTRARLRSYGGVPGLNYLIEIFVPRMRDKGISQSHVQLFFVENPARVFSRPSGNSEKFS
jgi:phosphotriesterase-related protein